MNKQINIFLKKNTSISIVLFFAIGIILTYLLSMEKPELFPGLEKWFNLLFQLCVGYVINFMFYLMQVYIPNKNRDNVVHKCLAIRIRNIIQQMQDQFISLGKIYLKDQTCTLYTEEQLKCIVSKLNLSNYVEVEDVATNLKFTVSEYINICIYKTESGIDKLFMYYTQYITPELMTVLENILNCEYHKNIKLSSQMTGNVSFKDNYKPFIEYNNYMKELKNIYEREFS